MSDSTIALGFNTEVITLPIDQITPTKMIADSIIAGTKYQQILSSVKAVGIIEPLVVSQESQTSGYFLLDGHLRLRALQQLELTSAACLLSTDDEAYTYNKHVNRLAPIQEHRMIVKAVERGVSEEKLAIALNLDVKSIVNKRNLLNGICEEAAELLKDKIVPGGVFPLLKRMIPIRQMEAASLMIAANNYTVRYAKAILGGTPKDQLKNPEQPKKIQGLDPEQMAKMEAEMSSLHREYRLIEESYGADVLNLTLAKGYLTSLLENTRVVRYLSQHHPNILKEFEKITDITSLEEGAMA